MSNPAQGQDTSRFKATGLFYYQEGSAQDLNASASTVLDADAPTGVILQATAPTKFAVGVNPTAGEHGHPGGVIAFMVKAGHKVWVDGEATLSIMD
jgi:hypothetical protein